ncbi:hypothetical protein GQS52_02945 [Streptomyces sp. SCUT-3]|uniref:hypothetical protein n=1 Tax=Streptomyces sp. SCUT-3 TaxID=2684469 RepID=UPI000CC30931|nr:hypothetical protein [Streptomyces sp. SCUT-3]PLW71168.1 hypothetical protein C0036_19255 [Streptomyces sp. DJ]QMV20920.1 hypothetical protein GQS52_02945 [Streptomyces sp. SCUT-3]
MSKEREIGEEDLMADAVDRQQARRLHRALRTLRDDPSVDAPLKEMAREVLSGRTTMGDAIRSDRYLGALGSRLAELKRVDDGLSPEERERRREQAEKFFREQEEAEQEESGEKKEDSRGGGSRAVAGDGLPSGLVGISPRPPRRGGGFREQR